MDNEAGLTLSPNRSLPKTKSMPEVTTLDVNTTNNLGEVVEAPQVIELKEQDNQAATVSPIAFKREGGRASVVTSDEKDRLESAISKIANGNPSTELVYTSEYSLFSEADKAEPITFDNNGNPISGQATVIDAICETKRIAASTNKVIILSGICEERCLKSGRKVTLNANVIIFPDGQMSRRYKISDSYDMVKEGDNWSYSQLQLEDKAEKGTLMQATVTNFVLPSGRKVGMVICNEIGNLQLMDRATTDIDILVIPKSGPINIPPFDYVSTRYEKSVRNSLSSIASTIHQPMSKPMLISVSDERCGESVTCLISRDGQVNECVFV